MSFQIGAQENDISNVNLFDDGEPDVPASQPEEPDYSDIFVAEAPEDDDNDTGDEGDEGDDAGEEDTLESLFDQLGKTERERQQSAQQAQQNQQQERRPYPTGNEAPPEFDPQFLDDTHVQRLDLDLQSAFSRALADPNVTREQLASTAYQASLKVAQIKAQYAKMVAAAYQLHQDHVGLRQQLEPFNRVQTARLLAERFGVSDYKKLLVHPSTKKPIDSPVVMETIASLIGERDRQTRVKQEQKKSRGARPTGGRSGGNLSQGRSFKNMTPEQFRKADAEIDARLERGERIRLVR